MDMNNNFVDLIKKLTLALLLSIVIGYPLKVISFPNPGSITGQTPLASFGTLTTVGMGAYPAARGGAKVPFPVCPSGTVLVSIQELSMQNTLTGYESCSCDEFNCVNVPWIGRQCTPGGYYPYCLAGSTCENHFSWGNPQLMPSTIICGKAGRV